MRAWMLIPLFGLGVVGGLLLLSLGSVFGLAAMVWGFVVFPQGVAYISRHRRTRGVGGGDTELDDVDTHYWRTTDWHTTAWH